MGSTPDDRSGMAVSGAGDINADGFDDLLIGAYWADCFGNPSAGKTYVVFGKADGFAASLELSSLDGTNGFAINGIKFFDVSGYSVSGAGDVNGDGFDDLLIGAPGPTPTASKLPEKHMWCLARQVVLQPVWSSRHWTAPTALCSTASIARTSRARR